MKIVDDDPLTLYAKRATDNPSHPLTLLIARYTLLVHSFSAAVRSCPTSPCTLRQDSN